MKYLAFIVAIMAAHCAMCFAVWGANGWHAFCWSSAFFTIIVGTVLACSVPDAAVNDANASK